MTFRVGQKVACVDADGDSEWHKSAILHVGQVYTIREIGLTGKGEPGIRLVERELTAPSRFIGRHTRRPLKDNFYRASRFRPIVERKTDISIFTAMLNPSKKKERA